MDKTTLLFMTGLLFIVSCSIVEVTPEGRNVKVVDENPPNTCQFLDKISLSPSLCNRDCQKNTMINEAARIGGNTLKIESYGLSTEQYNKDAIGLVYACK
jgi:hypothetical protein